MPEIWSVIDLHWSLIQQCPAKWKCLDSLKVSSRTWSVNKPGSIVGGSFVHGAQHDEGFEGGLWSRVVYRGQIAPLHYLDESWIRTLWWLAGEPTQLACQYNTIWYFTSMVGKSKSGFNQFSKSSWIWTWIVFENCLLSEWLTAGRGSSNCWCCCWCCLGIHLHIYILLNPIVASLCIYVF